MLLFRGLTLVVLEGKTVGGLPEGFKKMGNGFLPEIGPDTDLHNLTMVLGVAGGGDPGRPGLPQARGGASRYNFEVLPFPLFALKQVVLGAVIMEFAYLLADARGLPIVGLILFALIGDLHLHHARARCSVATSTRSAATSTRPRCPASTPGGSTSSS